jgi:hypothetical protein
MRMIREDRTKPAQDFAPAARQASEQNFTCAQSRAHFLRQLKGRLHAAQTLLGKSSFAGFTPFAFLRAI